jgi:hypothetical protein
MSVISDLIDAASGDVSPVATLLRKVKVVAARLHTGQLEQWVQHELMGYPSEVPLPEYRGPFAVEAAGHFAGPFQSGLRNAPIPSIGFPAEQRGALFTMAFRQPIAELEH